MDHEDPSVSRVLRVKLSLSPHSFVKLRAKSVSPPSHFDLDILVFSGYCVSLSSLQLTSGPVAKVVVFLDLQRF